MGRTTHLHFLKLGSEHLQFGVLNLLGSLIGSLEDSPRLFSGLYMSDIVKFFSRNTTKIALIALLLEFAKVSAALSHSALGLLVSPTHSLNGIPNGLINST